MLNSNSMGGLQRGLRRGLQQIGRDRTWGATLTLFTSLMVLTQLFLVFLLGVHGTGRLLMSRAGIQLEVLPSAQESEIQQLYAALQSHPSVQDVSYIPKEQAYEREKARDPELVAFLEEYELDNPFPDTLAVTLSSLESYDSFLQEVQQPQWRNVINPAFLTSASDREGEIRTLLEVTGGMRTLSIIFVIIAFVLLFCMILEWVTRNTANRGHELLLEHLLGASPLTVLVPFAAEVGLLLVAGTVIATGIVVAFIMLLPVFMPALALESAFRQLQTEMGPLLFTYLPLFLLIEIIAMPILAGIGTYIGAKKYLPKSFVFFA